MTEGEIITESNTNKVLALQDYLSIGYIFLLVLGIFHETIYYKFLGVNILDYSSILDVLISPISVIFGNLVLGFTVVVAVFLAYGYLKLIPRYYNWLGTKKRYQQGKNKQRLERGVAKLKSKNGTLMFICFFVFSLFIGLAIRSGNKTNDRIQNDDFKLTHLLLFKDGEQQEIKMLGKNSLYVFYVIKGKDEVSIAPIDGNIKLIKKLKE